jgi:hypothetical protein
MTKSTASDAAASRVARRWANQKELGRFAGKESQWRDVANRVAREKSGKRLTECELCVRRHAHPPGGTAQDEP